MFSPETPPPSYQHHRKAPSKKGLDWTWLKIVIQVVVIAAGLSGLSWMVLHNPDKKELVCDKSKQIKGSLTAFGSCREKK